MDLIPIPATKPDSPAVSSDAFGGEPGFGDLIDCLLAGITGANGGQPGTDGEDVDPDDPRGSEGTVPPEPLPGPGIPGTDVESPATGPPSLPNFEGWDRPTFHVGGESQRSVSAPEVPATPISPPLALAAADQLQEVDTAIPETIQGVGPAVPAPAATDEATKTDPVPTGAPAIPGSDPTTPGVVASPAREVPRPNKVIDQQPTPPGSTSSLPSDGPDPTATDATIVRPQNNRTPETEPVTPMSRIDPQMGSSAGEAPEGQVARITPPPTGADRPGMAELVDRIREWADRVENTQRTDTISLKLADPDGELLVRLAMRDGRLEVNVSRPGGESPSWLLDQLDEALTRRGFDLAGGGDRHRPGNGDGEAGETLAGSEQPRPRTTKRDRDGLWM